MKHIKTFEEQELKDILAGMEKDKPYKKYKYKYMVVKIRDDYASGGKEILLLAKFISIFMGNIMFEYYNKKYEDENNYDKFTYQAKIEKTDILEVFDDFEAAKKYHEEILKMENDVKHYKI